MSLNRIQTLAAALALGNLGREMKSTTDAIMDFSKSVSSYKFSSVSQQGAGLAKGPQRRRTRRIKP